MRRRCAPSSAISPASAVDPSEPRTHRPNPLSRETEDLAEGKDRRDRVETIRAGAQADAQVRRTIHRMLETIRRAEMPHDAVTVAMPDVAGIADPVPATHRANCFDAAGQVLSPAPQAAG